MAEFLVNNSLGFLPPNDIAEHLMDIGAFDDAKHFAGGEVAAQGLP
jgi:hypothetical protein